MATDPCDLACFDKHLLARIKNGNNFITSWETPDGSSTCYVFGCARPDVSGATRSWEFHCSATEWVCKDTAEAANSSPLVALAKAAVVMKQFGSYVETIEHLEPEVQRAVLKVMFPTSRNHDKVEDETATEKATEPSPFPHAVQDESRFRVDPSPFAICNLSKLLPSALQAAEQQEQQQLDSPAACISTEGAGSLASFGSVIEVFEEKALPGPSLDLGLLDLDAEDSDLLDDFCYMSFPSAARQLQGSGPALQPQQQQQEEEEAQAKEVKAQQQEKIEQVQQQEAQRCKQAQRGQATQPRRAPSGPQRPLPQQQVQGPQRQGPQAVRTPPQQRKPSSCQQAQPPQALLSKPQPPMNEHALLPKQQPQRKRTAMSAAPNKISTQVLRSTTMASVTKAQRSDAQQRPGEARGCTARRGC